MEKLPLVPAVPLCSTKDSALSTSEMVSVPPVVSGSLVSSSETVAEERTAASLVPLMVTVTTCVLKAPVESAT